MRYIALGVCAFGIMLSGCMVTPRNYYPYHWVSPVCGEPATPYTIAACREAVRKYYENMCCYNPTPTVVQPPLIMTCTRMGGYLTCTQ